MDYQKDNKKTEEVSSYNSGLQSAVSTQKSLAIKANYEYLNKKTEKLVTALYMVTDCMDTDDALKNKIRILGVELLSDMYKILNLSPIDKKNHTSVTLSHINEILSLIEISCTIGFISEMNTSILKRELLSLISELDIGNTKANHFTFTLDQEMFDFKNPESELSDSKKVEFNNLKDMPVLINKKTSMMSLGNHNGISQKDNHTIPNKEDRTKKIISIIKDTSKKGEGISIKDISVAFIDCSEKTIQRELNVLVEKGLIKKTGAKRWSRYSTITN